MLKKYFSLVKFSHTIFAMPFALIGFFLAVKETDIRFADEGWKLLVFVVMEMIFARNAAMGFNRWSDRKIDAANPRTLGREIPSGKVPANSALFFVIINAGLFVLTAYFINFTVFLLSPVALAVVLGYSLTKRITWLCHLILGLGLSLAPLGAYLSVTAEFDLLPVLFSLIVLFWTAGFDIIYALQDIRFDKEQKLKSLPVLLGKKKALRLSEFLHLLSAGLLVWAGITAYSTLGILFIVGVFIFLAALVYQHIIVKPDDLSRVNLAFFTTNGIASVVLGAFTVAGLYVSV